MEQRRPLNTNGITKKDSGSAVMAMNCGSLMKILIRKRSRQH